MRGKRIRGRIFSVVEVMNNETGSGRKPRQKFEERRDRAIQAIAATRGMPPAQTGVFYTIAYTDPYTLNRRGALLDDDVARAAECNCGLAEYRRLKAALVARGAFSIHAGIMTANMGGGVG